MVSLCYVCNQSSSEISLKSLVESKSQYTNKFCIEIINEILSDISRRQIYNESDCICGVCFKLIEDYDLHCLSAELRKNRLRQLLVKSILLHNKNVTVKRPAEKIITNRSESNPLPEKIRKLTGPIDNSKVILNKPKPIDYVKLHVILREQKSQIEQMPAAENVAKVAPNGLMKIISNGPLKVVPRCPVKVTSNGPLKGAVTSHLKIVPNGPIKVDATSQLKVAPRKPRAPRVKKIEINCEKCNRTFQNDKIGNRGLKFHMQWHETHPEFQCYICYFHLSDKESLINHLKLHAGRSKYECVFCGKEYVKAVRSHVEQVHGEKNKLCDYCGAAFTSSHQLRMHQKTHTKEFKGECDICGHVVHCRSNLLAHLRSHLNVRPFTCSVCGMQFKRADTLRTHEKRHYEDTKTLKCTMCPSAFEHKFYLKQHMLRKHRIVQLGDNSSYHIGR